MDIGQADPSMSHLAPQSGHFIAGVE